MPHHQGPKTPLYATISLLPLALANFQRIWVTRIMLVPSAQSDLLALLIECPQSLVLTISLSTLPYLQKITFFQVLHITKTCHLSCLFNPHWTRGHPSILISFDQNWRTHFPPNLVCWPTNITCHFVHWSTLFLAQKCVGPQTLSKVPKQPK